MKITVYRQKISGGRISYSLKVAKGNFRTFEKIQGASLVVKASDRNAVREAERIAEQARVERQAGIFNGTSKTSLVEYVRNESKRKGKRSAETFRQAATHLEAFEKLTRQRLIIEDLTPRELQSFVEYLTAKGLRASSVTTYFKRIETAIRAAMYLDELISFNPCVKVKLPKVQQSDCQPLNGKQLHCIELLTVAERATRSRAMSKNILSQNEARTRDAFIFACYGDGARLGDVQTLGASNIDGDMIRYTQAKTGKVQRVVLTDKAAEILERYKPLAAKNIFGIGTKQQVNKHLKIIAQAAGLEINLHFHLARYTALFLMKRANVPLDVARDMLRHSSTRITEKHYERFDESRMRTAVGLLNSLSRSSMD
jgi:integrase